MDIQWYPGHMTKARRAMEEDLKLVDIVIQVLDARAVLSSKNPDVEKMAANKKKVYILNKNDLADEEVSKAWKACFEASGGLAVTLDARNNKGMRDVKLVLEKAAAEKKAKDLKRGILNRPARAMIAGIPNVGKSTLINSLVGKTAAKTGNKPGVTKGNQWIKLSNNLELLDTPGLLWPKFEDKAVGIKLALLGTVNDDVLEKQELAAEGVKLMNKRYPGLLAAFYGLEAEDGYDFLDALAKSKHMLLKGGEADIARAANLFTDDLRKGKWGRFSLETCENGGNA